MATSTSTSTAAALDQPLIRLEHPIPQELLAHLPTSIVRMVHKAIPYLLEPLCCPYAVDQLWQWYRQNLLIKQQLVEKPF
jgi:hypothetical protein